MRATMRITWLLLSLSLLSHSVCCDGGNNSTATAAATTAVNNITPELTTVPVTLSRPQTTDPTNIQATTAAPTVHTVTPEVRNTAAINTMIMSTKSAGITQPQASTVTNNLPAQVSVITVAPSAVDVNGTSAAAATSSPSIITPPPATSGSSSSISAATTQMPETSSPSKSSRTEPTLTPVSVGTNKTTEKDMKPDQQPKNFITLTPSTVAVTGTSPSHIQTATHSREAAGSTGATSVPSTPTAAGRPAAASVTAGTMSSQTTTTRTTTAPQTRIFSYSLNSGQEKGDEKHLVEVCRWLMGKLQEGNCTLTWRQHNGKVQFDCVEINGKVKTALAAQYYEEITKTPTDNKTLIAILASCGALLIMIVILAVCASHHRKPYSENQQHLTEELHTVENGYHDNPTLEVMEVQPEMQEKKVALNGEFNDSWIVPIDNLLKEDIPDEEDTHL